MSLRKGIIKVLLPFAAVIFFLTGCYKDDPSEFIPNAQNGDIAAFYDAVQSLERTVVFDVQIGEIIITNDNSIITIEGSVFMDAGGNVINSGNVSFDYLMIKDKGVLVMYNKPTVSDGSLLESGGVFFFEAWNEERTTQYFLRPGFSIRVQSTSVDPQVNMELFYGEEVGNDYNWDLIENNSPDWNGVPVGEWAIQNAGVIVEGFGYDFLVDSLAWINCDIFNDVPANLKTSACIELPGNYSNQNTIAFAIFTDINSVVGLLGDADLEQFCEVYAQMPIGYEVTFISISSLGNDVYYFGMKNAVIEENHYEFMIPEQKTLQEILDILGMF